MEYEYPIDLDWSNEEMISVINFFNHVEKYYESGVTAGDFMGHIKDLKKLCLLKQRKNKFLILSKKVVAIIVTKQFKM
ncbi:putative transcriptional regulator [Staphylococcus aureus]|nr:putative transcriptional regulator [Staphylococcus aureus]